MENRIYKVVEVSNCRERKPGGPGTVAFGVARFFFWRGIGSVLEPPHAPNDPIKDSVKGTKGFRLDLSKSKTMD